ncbi:MAG: recombinase family protein [Tenericutes bacterium]|nr:recombinase family protein [Mycoplasmatota bacterium]
MNKKIGLYIRVSSEKQLLEGFSFEDQEEKLIEEAKRDKREYILYKDGGITGKNMDQRLGLKQLMKDVEFGLIDKVFVTKISRLARNSRDLENIIYEFEKNNVYFKAISDGIDTSTPIGSVMVKLLGIFAEMERDIIIEQTRAGAEKRAKEGKMYGSGPILGYDRVPNGRTMKIIPNKTEKLIIEKIFNMYLGGYGYKAITNNLNNEGYRTKKHKLFAINTVKTILENPLYAGYIRYGKYKDWTKKRRKGLSEQHILVEGNHKAIISYEDYLKVQERMKTNQRKKPAVGKYILSGVLTCPECGSKMVGSKTVYKTKRGKVEKLYYTCSRFHNKGITACHSNGVRVDLIDPIVIKKIAKKLDSENLADTLYDYIVNSTIDVNSYDGKKRLLEVEISKLSTRKIELRGLYTEGIISTDELKEDIEKINHKTIEYQRLINDFEKDCNIQESTPVNISKQDVQSFLSNISNALKTNVESEKLKVKELIRIIVNKIDVKSKARLDIDIDINYKEILYKFLEADQ